MTPMNPPAGVPPAGRPTIGIAGVGYVGGAVKLWFESQKYPLFLYDKYKNIGSLEELNGADIIFLCLPTPFLEGKGFDDSAIFDVLEKIEGNPEKNGTGKVIVVKSTVLPGSTEKYQEKFPQHKFLMNPEFLTAKRFVDDFFNPDRQIVGYTEKSTKEAENLLRILPEAPIEKIVKATEAETIKYFGNVFLSNRVIFANQIYDICQKLGIDYEAVKESAGADRRIGTSHFSVLADGYRGYGGPCLPKDTKAFIRFAESLGVDPKLFKALEDINNDLIQKKQYNNKEEVMPEKIPEKILVTGGAGFIGSVLVPQLLERGYFVRVVDNLMYDQPPPSLNLLNEKFEFFKGDIRDEKLMKKALEGIDFIIHLAAIVGEPLCKKNPQLCHSVNTEGTELINNLRQENQKMIFASTGCVYGKVEGVCREDSPLNQLFSDYSISKRRAEEIINKKPNRIIYRFATGFGVSPRMKKDLMINDFIWQAIADKHIKVYEGGAKRSFIHVRDMAHGLVFALENFKSMKNEAYNVGSEQLNLTKRQIAEKIREKIPYKLEFANFATDPEQRDYEVSYQKIRDKGFNITINLNQGIEEVISCYKNFHE